jgi:hypothetical protein
MNNSLLLSLCRNLHKNEWKTLHTFAASPLHNTREDTRVLLRYIETMLAKQKEKQLEKSLVFSKLYPEKGTFDDDYLRYVMHWTHQVVRDFLGYQHWKQQETKGQLELIATLRQRKKQRNLEQLLDETSATLEKQAFRDSQYWYQSYQLHSEYYEHSVSKNRTQPAHFQEMSDTLNVFFMVQKLRQAWAALSHRSLSKTSDFQIDFLENVLEYIKKWDKRDEFPVVSLFYHGYWAAVEITQDAPFQAFKTLLLQHETLFSAATLKEIYIHAINCCIKRLNSGQQAYRREVFEVFRKGLQLNVLLEDGFLSRYTYNNIAMAGVGLQEFEWVEKFLYDFKPKIEEKFRESTFNHTLAMYYFKKPDYTNAMRLLQQVEFTDVLHNLDARRMLLLIYYELQEWTALDAHLMTFKTYLQRQKDLGYHKENYLNLIRFTQKLVSLDYDKKTFLAEIEATEALVERAWLVGKV